MQDERAGEAVSPDQTLGVATFEEIRGFTKLKEEWAELYRDSPSATPFQSWAWFYCRWDFYGGG
jgi:hypothetical protein